MTAASPNLIGFAGPRLQTPEVTATPYALEFVWLRQSTRIPIYMRRAAEHGNLSDCLYLEQDLPAFIKCRPYYSLNTKAGVFAPLENLLVSLYQDGKPPGRPLMDLLSDLRLHLLTKWTCTAGALVSEPLFRPEVAAAGFQVVNTRTYGRRLTAYVGWYCPADRQTPQTAPFFEAGALEFRPRPDRTLDTGRWVASATTPVATLLLDQLRVFAPVAPIHLLSDAGQAHLLAAYGWTALALMTKGEARQARVQFVREHSKLIEQPRELALAMCQAQLYSSTCNPHELTRYMSSLIAEAMQPAA